MSRAWWAVMHKSSRPDRSIAELAEQLSASCHVDSAAAACWRSTCRPMGVQAADADQEPEGGDAEPE